MRTVLPYTQPAPYHSQWGEDRWIAENLHLPTHGVFVDIGAGDGVRGSNTLYVENLGWRGLCVDADPRNHQRLRQRCCAVDTCAVSATTGLWPFGMYRHKPSWSGLHRTGTDYQQTLVTCRTLEDLLDQWCINGIDLLSIDVEGTELDVWKSFNPDKHQPKIVIIEYDDSHPDRHRRTIHDRLGQETYELVHVTPANLVLHRTDPRGRHHR
ncbi:FkbM family methyltransferase [Verrucosispora sp. WMMA2044]|uniref:FkbM family methyltransferase n=1 Tax=unclassified Micromonospora TaxID=2617518 RepID=UPI00248B74F0|nr:MULTISPECIES: FkbM family methyltransferase [unclassified Micromonospora]WBB46826.1 FkbM family methyltransferase [Verrucosispora sp. WMMA2044]